MLELIFQGFMEWFYGLALECWEYFSSSLLGIMSMDYAYMKSHVPVMDSIAQMLLAAGWALLLGNLVFQALRSMASGIGFDGEDPKLLFTRTFVFSFLLLASPQICEIGLNMTGKIMELLEIPDAIDVTLVDASMFGSLGAAWLLVIIFGIIIMFKVFRLLLEIAERYVILAVLTITAPLAFAMGGSKSTSEIFSGWCRMFGSMCTLMVTNVIFFKMLLSVLSTVPTGLDIIPWIVLILTIVKVARKADAIITRIGLNPAITGDSLGRGLPGALTYAVVRTTASQITKTFGKPTGRGGQGAAPNTPTGGPRIGGGPSGAQSAAGYAASYHTQKTSQQQNSSQAAGQQGFVSQQNSVQQGTAQASTQEHTASAASQSSSVIRQASFKTAEARKSSVPLGARRAPNYVPTVNHSAPGGAQVHNAAGNTEPSAVRGPSAANTPIRTSATVQRTVSGTTASASQHDPAGKPAAPSSTRISQVNTQRMQSQVNSGAVRNAAPTERTPPRASDHTAQAAAQKRSPGGAGISPPAALGSKPAPQTPATGTRYTQRPAPQPRMMPAQGTSPAAQQAAVYKEPARPGPAGTASAPHPTQVSAAGSAHGAGEWTTSSAPPAVTSTPAPRPGRNVPQSGAAPSVQTRQPSPARQEPRRAETRGTLASGGAAPVQHPGPAGNKVSRPERATSMPAAGTPATMPGSMPTLTKSPSSAIIKGSAKKNEGGAVSRKQRGKKHE